LKCGYPERFAQQALGHNSKAVHYAYSKHAEVTVPSLDDWEKEWGKNSQLNVQPKLLPVDFRSPLAAISCRLHDMPMKTRFRLIHCGERGNQFYCVDSETGKRFSLKSKDRDAALQIVLAKNQSPRQPSLNLQITKAYLAGTDNGVATRTPPGRTPLKASPTPSRERTSTVGERRPEARRSRP
jgi:hypothetical protein